MGPLNPQWQVQIGHQVAQAGGCNMCHYPASATGGPRCHRGSRVGEIDGMHRFTGEWCVVEVRTADGPRREDIGPVPGLPWSI